MIYVWVLFAVTASGNFSNFYIPTMEFDSADKCMAAVKVFKEDVKANTGAFMGRCVKVEK